MALDSVEPGQIPHRSAIGAGGELGVGLERRRHLASAWLLGLELARRAALHELRLGDAQLDAAPGDVDADAIAALHERDVAARRRLRRDMPDRETAGAAGEATVGDQRASFTEALRLDVARRIQHLLHAGAAARAFVTHHHDVARLHHIVQDRVDGLVLALYHQRWTFEHEQLRVDAGRLHHAAV